MRRTLTLCALATALLVAACQDSDQVLSPNDPADAPLFSIRQQADEVVPGRVLVRLTDGADPASVGRAHGVSFDRTIANGRVAIFSGAVGNERALAARLGGDNRVVYAEPDYLRQPTTIDPKMWAFYNPGGLSVTFTRGRNKGRIVESYLSVEDADEDNVEGYASGGGGAVSIASIDTGVQMDHPEFGGVTFVAGRDFVSDDDDPSDENDHGTHTTGTMVGDNVGVAGVAGAASKVTVYVYRVCGANGCPTSAIVSAIYAATDAGVVAMNLSLGGGSLSQSEADAILYATNNDALVIASAGNGSTSTVSCPACDPNAISVAASDWLDEHAYYTNYGEGLDITAPGGELYSNTTSEAGIYSSVRGGGYAYFQGTSMSAPQVTGTAAIVASVTGLTGLALRTRLESSTDDLGAIGYDTQFGWGRLNSYRAVTGTTLSEGSPPTNSAPTASFTHSCSGLTCDFTDTSSDSDGTIASWNWDFGDGGSSTAQNPSHTYAADGTYTVSLTVTDDVGDTDSASQNVSVSSGPTNSAPTASFMHSCSGLTCDFTDTSSDSDGTIASWNWDFGDGGSSTAQNPSHTYAADGTYTVSVTVTDDVGDTDTASQNVTVSSGGGGITLSAEGYKVKRGLQKADLTWSGATATSTNVDVYRDGALIDTTENDGFYTDNIDQRGGGSYEYQVCEAGTSTCSNTATVVF